MLSSVLLTLLMGTSKNRWMMMSKTGRNRRHTLPKKTGSWVCAAESSGVNFSRNFWWNAMCLSYLQRRYISISFENWWVEFFEQTNCSVSSDRANFPERIPSRDSEAHLILAATIGWCRSILVPRCLPVCATPNKRPIDQVWTHYSSKWVRWRYRRAS